MLIQSLAIVDVERQNRLPRNCCRPTGAQYLATLGMCAKLPAGETAHFVLKDIINGSSVYMVQGVYQSRASGLATLKVH